MKNYREIADSVFARRDQYVIAQRKKKQAITRVTASVGSVALVSLAGIALFQNDAFHDAPAIAKPTTATVTHSPMTEDTAVTTAPAVTIGGAESTAGDTQPTQTEPTASQAAPTVTQTKPTATQARPTATQSKSTATQSKPTTPTKTEPSKTTPTNSEKVVIRARQPDNTGVDDNVEMSKYERYVSRLLEEMMTLYEGEDVVYAVIVSIPMMGEYKYDFWNSNEEWVQLIKEKDEAHDAWFEEAKLVNPAWDSGAVRDIEVWTDTMRANYERFNTLTDEIDSIRSEYLRPYVQMCIDQRFEALKEVSSIEPVDIQKPSGASYTANAYYVELTADAINALAERGGYRFCLATYEDMNVLIDA